jgi:cytoskeletal protein CcmA (bactofilin family)
MDPSALQSDPDNDVHSLEGNTTVVEQGASLDDNTRQPGYTPPTNGSSPLNTSGSVAPLVPPPDKQPNIFKRLWRKLNIYLLLFFVLLLIAAAVVIFMTIKGRESDTIQNTITTQELSDSTLKQLANSDATIGNPKQILNIESNAIFAGSVLVRNDLEVAGSIKVNGALALPGITVSGSSTFNQIQATNLNLSGGATVNGTLTARNGLSVNGNSNFSGNVSAGQLTTGSLQLNGELRLTSHIVGGGPIPALNQGVALGAGGTASLSGSDTSGTININTGGSPGAGCFATVNFSRGYNGTPHVVVTPIGAAAGSLNFYVNRSSGNFSVCTTNPPPSSQSFAFDYMIMN